MSDLKLPYTKEELLNLLGNIKNEEELREFIQQNGASAGGGHTDEEIRIIVAEWYQANKDTQLTKEDVDGWIAEYLEANPVSGGLTEQQVNEIVAAYIRDNNISGSVSAEEIAQAVEDYIAAHPITGVTTEDIQNAVNSYLAEHPVEGGTMDEDTFDEMADEWIENIKIAGANLPIVFLEGDMTGISKENAVPMKFRFVSQFKSFEETCTLKYQGTSSMGYPKKNFTVKLDSKHGVGWGKQKKYCLKANYIDHSHARNIVSARLWSQVVSSRSDYAEMPELLRTSPNNGAVDGFPIRVYLNETYQGLYTMNVPKGSWQFKMDDTNENHCILCGENYVSGCFRGSANIDGTDWSDELHDIVPDSVKNRWNQVIDFVMNSTDEDFKANITNYIDLQSLIDYYIFAYASTGLDALGKNQIYYTYDGQKYYASMYDMDSTWGMYWNGQRFVSDTYRMQDDYETKIQDREGNLLYYRVEELFRDEIEVRYAELRSGVLSYSNILGEFERFMSCIATEQYSEDLTIYTDIPSGTTNNIAQLRNYVAKRLSYVDGIIYKVGVTSISITGVSSVKLSSTVKLGASFEPTNANNYSLEWSSSNTDVATIDNTGLVTPVSIGDVTITVHDTISDASAEFNLQVIGDTEIIEGTAYYGSKVTDYAETTDISLPYKNFMVFGPGWNSQKRTILCFEDPAAVMGGSNTIEYSDTNDKKSVTKMIRKTSDETALDKNKAVGYYWDDTAKQWTEFDPFVESMSGVYQSFAVVSTNVWWTRNNTCCLYFSNFDIYNENGDFVLSANYNQSDYE